jgi:hypothetical protein
VARTRKRRGPFDEAFATLHRDQSLLQQHLLQLQTAFERNQTALEQNLATLVQSQAAFTARRAETDPRIAATEERIECRFANIMAILSELLRRVERLPEAICEKIGFRAPGQQTG